MDLLRRPQLLERLAELLHHEGKVREAILSLEEARRLPGNSAQASEKLAGYRWEIEPDLVSFASADALLEAGEPLVEEGAEWRFFRGLREPSEGLSWTEPGFDDAAWEEGPSGFGYEDGDDRTILSDMKGKYTTVYVRRSFIVEDPAVYTKVALSVRADDGFVAYLNGKEVGRALAREPGTRLAFDAVATGNATEPLKPSEISIAPELLWRGRNVLAIQGLNASLESSDLSLIPELLVWGRGQRSAGAIPRRFRRFLEVSQGPRVSVLRTYLEARLLQEAGKHSDAVEKLREVFGKLEEAAKAPKDDAGRTDPGLLELWSEPEPIQRLAESLLELGKSDEAEAALSKALAAEHDESALWQLWLKAASGRPESSVSGLLSRFPGDTPAEGCGYAADMHWALGQLATQGALRIHCGGEEYRSPSGKTWGRDRFYGGGEIYFLGAFVYSGAVHGTDEPDLYRTERYFPESHSAFYSIPLPPGSYRVVLHFAEIAIEAAGSRFFDVAMEGTRVLENYEPRAVGFSTADKKTFEVVVDDCALEIRFFARLNGPKISSIEVERLSAVALAEPRAAQGVSLAEERRPWPDTTSREWERLERSCRAFSLEGKFAEAAGVAREMGALLSSSPVRDARLERDARRLAAVLDRASGLSGEGATKLAKNLGTVELPRLESAASRLERAGRDSEAQGLREEALRLSDALRAPDDPKRPAAYSSLGENLSAQGKLVEARPLLERALELRREQGGEESPDYEKSLKALGFLYETMHEYTRAEPLYRKALEADKKRLGEDHPDYAVSLNCLARVHQAKGNSVDAERLFKQALEIQRKRLGEDHADYAASLVNLAAVYQAMDDYVRAEPLLKQALEIQRRRLGEDHPEYGVSINNLGFLYKEMGDYTKAEPLLKQALEIYETRLGREHPHYAMSLDSLASLYQARGDHEQAEALYRNALEIRRKRLGEEHPDFIGTLGRLASLYRGIADYARAEGLLKQALEIQGKRLGQDHPDCAASLGNLGSLYQAMGDCARAEPVLKQALEIRRARLGEDHLDCAASLDSLAFVYREMGDYAKAEPLLKQALEIRRTRLGEGHPDYATSLDDLGFLYEHAGQYARAEPLLKQALEIKRKELGEDHPSYARTLLGLGLLHRRLGDYSRAEALFKQALEICGRRLGEDHPGYASSLDLLGGLYVELGDYGRAEPLLQRALDLRSRRVREDHIDFATSLHNLAALYGHIGDFGRAEALYKRALAIRKKRLGEQHPEYATSLSNLAVFYYYMDDFARAEPLFCQAFDIRRERLGEDHPDCALSLSQLGVLYQHLGAYTIAEMLLQGALETSKKRLGERHPECARSLHYLAALYRDMGDYPRAELLCKQVLEIWGERLGKEHPDYAASLGNLGWLYHQMGNWARAENVLEEALAIKRRLLELTSSVQSERQQLDMTTRLRGVLDGFFSLALEAGLPAEKPYAHLLAWKGAIYSRQHRLRALRKQPEIEPLFRDLESASSRLAALVFAEPKPEEEECRKTQIAELAERSERLEKELSARAAEFRRSAALTNIGPIEVQALLPEGTALLDLIEFSWYFKSPDKNPGDIPKGSATRPARSERHLLAFVIRRDRPVEQVDLGALKPIAEAVDAWRRPYERDEATVGPTPEELRAQAEAALELRRRILTPLDKHLEGVRALLVSPDGASARLPIAALPGTAPDSYLIEELPVAILPFPQMLPELLGAPKEESGVEDGAPAEGDSRASVSLLLVGDVDYDADLAPSLAARGERPAEPGKSSDAAAPAGAAPPASPSVPSPAAAEVASVYEEKKNAPRGDRSLRFRQLEYTAGEMLTVAHVLELAEQTAKIVKLWGSRATEAAFRENAPTSRYIHLATHGFFAPAQLLSALSRKRPDREPLLRERGPGLENLGGPGPSLVRMGFVGWHPGLLSGIVFAGANREPAEEGSDGILTALELAPLDLSDVELLVFSACDTGLGSTAGGEGLLGLQRAAQVAGAKTVVASLWSVGDQDALALMTRFYRNLWAKKMPKLEALREAQLAVLRGDLGRGAGGIAPRPDGKSPRVSPRAWAAWVLSGDWR